MGIYKLPKNQWTKDGRKYKFYWNEKDKSGKWKKKFSQAYKTKLDAMNAEREFLNNKVEFGGDMDMTFGTLTDQYIESQKNKVRRRTMETYLKRRRYFTSFENVKLKDMDGNLYHKFQQELWDKPIKCSSRNDIQKFLKIILNWGMKMYDINLMRFYKKIEFFKDSNEIKEEKDVYTFEEFQKYIMGATNLNDKTMFEMLYYCGLRRGECRGLQWSDIDSDKIRSVRYTDAELRAIRETMKVAILYALGYLFEHREEADHHDLALTLRSLLFAVREGVV